jgi:RimJ/RimL family protein N-acetyltransferase
MGLESWTGAKHPQPVTLEGHYARLEPLNAEQHGADLLSSALVGGRERFRYLFDSPPPDMEHFTHWLHKAERSEDPLFFAVIDRADGRAHGRQSLMRIEPAHGVIEVGNILWGPGIARTRIATEALYLFAAHAFDRLGYRRLEWKCDARNAPSRRAALRFGFQFEGVFRQHMVVKGQNRDTAWFAMLDNEWPAIRTRFTTWLEPANFDDAGQQKHPLVP